MVPDNDNDNDEVSDDRAEQVDPVVMPRSTSSSTLRDLHRLLTNGTIQDVGGPAERDPAMGRRLHFGGLTTRGRHWLAYRRRGWALQSEATPATGQAALWLRDVEREAPRSGVDVARQLARLCGEDSTVSVTTRNLADAVGVRDSLGRKKAYSERGVQWLVENGWLIKRVMGQGRGAKTTFLLSSP